MTKKRSLFALLFLFLSLLILNSCKEGEAPPTLEDPDENLIERVEIRLKRQFGSSLQAPEFPVSDFNNLPSDKKIHVELYGIMTDGSERLLKKKSLIRWSFSKPGVSKGESGSGYAVFQFGKDETQDSKPMIITAEYGPSFETNSQLLVVSKQMTVITPVLKRIELTPPDIMDCNKSNSNIAYDGMINNQCTIGEGVNSTTDPSSDITTYFKGTAYLSNNQVLDVSKFCPDNDETPYGIKIYWKEKSRDGTQRISFEKGCGTVEGVGLGKTQLYLSHEENASYEDTLKRLESNNILDVEIIGGYLKSIHFKQNLNNFTEPDEVKVASGADTLMVLNGTLSTTKEGSGEHHIEPIDLEKPHFSGVRFWLMDDEENLEINSSNRVDRKGKLVECKGEAVNSENGANDEIIATVQFKGNGNFFVVGKKTGRCIYPFELQDGAGEVMEADVTIDVSPGNLKRLEILSLLPDESETTENLVIPFSKDKDQLFRFKAITVDGDSELPINNIFNEDYLIDGDKEGNTQKDDTQDGGATIKPHMKVRVMLHPESEEQTEDWNVGVSHVKDCVDQAVDTYSYGNPPNEVIGLKLTPKRPCHLKIQAYYLHRDISEDTEPWFQDQEATADISFVITEPVLKNVLTIESIKTEHGHIYNENHPLPYGVSTQLKAFAERTDGEKEDVTHLATWSTDQEDLILVGDGTSDYPGRILGLKSGSVTISAKYSETTPQNEERTATGSFSLKVGGKQLLGIKPTIKVGDDLKTLKSTSKTDNIVNLEIGGYHNYNLQVLGYFTDPSNDNFFNDISGDSPGIESTENFDPASIKPVFLTDRQCEDEIEASTGKASDAKDGNWVWCYPEDLLAITDNENDTSWDRFRTKDKQGEGFIKVSAYSKLYKRNLQWDIHFIVDSPLLNSLTIFDGSSDINIDQLTGDEIPDGSTFMIPRGDSRQLRAIAEYISTEYPNKDVTTTATWSIGNNDSKILEVNNASTGIIKNGLITAIGTEDQEAKLTVTLKDRVNQVALKDGVYQDDRTKDIKITVKIDKPVQRGLRLEFDRPFLAAGETIKYTLTRTYSDHGLNNPKTVQLTDYKTIPLKQLTFDHADNKTTAVIPGSTSDENKTGTITATDDSVTGKLDILATEKTAEGMDVRTIATLFITDGILDESHDNTKIIDNPEEHDDFQVGRTIKPKAYGQFTDLGADASSDLSSYVTWDFDKDSPCKEECVILQPDGTITAKSVGKVILVATYPDRNETKKEYTIEVKPKKVEKYAIVSAALNIGPEELEKINRFSDIRSDFTAFANGNQQFQILKIYQYDLDGTELLTGNQLKNFTWKADPVTNSNVVPGEATIDTGLLTPIAIGQVKLTITSKGDSPKTATAIVDIQSPVLKGLFVSHEKDGKKFEHPANDVPAGRSFQFYATADYFDKNDKNEENKDVTSLVSWDVVTGPATFDPKTPGKLVINKSHTGDSQVTVIAKLWGKEQPATINVTDPELENIKLNPTAILVDQGSKVEFTIDPENSAGGKFDTSGKTVTWRFVDNNLDISHCKNQHTCSFWTNDLPQGVSYDIEVSLPADTAKYAGISKTSMKAKLFVGHEELVDLKIEFPEGYDGNVPINRSLQLEAYAIFQNGTKWNVTRQVTWETTESCAGFPTSDGAFPTKGLLKLDDKCEEGTKFPVTATLKYTNKKINSDEEKKANEEITVVAAEYDHIEISPNPLFINEGNYPVDGKELSVKLYDSIGYDSTLANDDLIWSYQEDPTGDVVKMDDLLKNEINNLPEGIYTLKVEVPDDEGEYQCRFLRHSCKTEATTKVVVKNGILKTLTISVDGDQSTNTISIEEGDKKKLKVEGDFSATDDTTVTTMDMTDAVKWSIDPATCANIIQENGEHWIRANSHVYNSDGTPKSDDCESVKLAANFDYGDSSRDTDRDFEITQRSTIKGYRIDPSPKAMQLGLTESFELYNVYEYSDVSTDKTGDPTILWKWDPFGTVGGIAKITTANNGEGQNAITVKAEAVGEVILKAFVQNQSKPVDTSTIRIFSAPPSGLVISHEKGKVTFAQPNGRLPEGRELQLYATAVYPGEDGDILEDVTSLVKWTSPEILTSMTSPGLLKNLRTDSEEATVTVSVELWGKTASVDVQVTKAVMNRMNLTPAAKLVNQGDEVTFTITPEDSDGNPMDMNGKTIQWSLLEKPTFLNDYDCNGKSTCSFSTTPLLRGQAYTVRVILPNEVTSYTKDTSADAKLFVGDTRFSNLRIESPFASVPQNRSMQLKAVAIFNNGTEWEVTEQADWEVVDNNCANFPGNTGLLETTNDCAGGSTELTVKATLRYEGTTAPGTEATSDTLPISVAAAEYDRIEITPNPLVINEGNYPNGETLTVNKYSSAGGVPDSINTDLTWKINGSEVGSLEDEINALPEGIHTLEVSVPDNDSEYKCQSPTVCSRKTTAKVVVKNGILETLTISVGEPAMDTIEIEEGDKKRLKVKGSFTATDDTTVTTMDMTDAVKWNIEPATCANIIQESGEHWIQANSHVYNSDGRTWVDNDTNCEEVKLIANFDYGDSSKDTSETFDITPRSTIKGYRIDPSPKAMKLGLTESFELYNVYEYSDVSTDKTGDPTILWKWDPFGTVGGIAKITTANNGEGQNTITVKAEAVGEVILKAFVQNQPEPVDTSTIRIFSAPPSGLVISHEKGKVTFAQPNGRLPEGRALQLYATAVYPGENGDIFEDVTSLVKWTSPEILTRMDFPGLLKNLRTDSEEATVTVSVELWGKTASQDIKVTKAVMNRMNLSPGAKLVNQGDEVTFTIMPEDSDGNSMDMNGKNIQWSLLENPVFLNDYDCNGKSTCSFSTTPLLRGQVYTVRVSLPDEAASSYYAEGTSADAKLFVGDTRFSNLRIESPFASVPQNRSMQLKAVAIFNNGTEWDVTGQADWEVVGNICASFPGNTGLLETTNDCVGGSTELTVKATLRYEGTTAPGTDETSDTHPISVAAAEYDRIEITPNPLVINEGNYPNGETLTVNRYSSAGGVPDSINTGLTWKINGNEVGSLENEINALPEGIHTLEVSVPDNDQEFQCQPPTVCSHKSTAKVVVKNGILKTLTISVDGDQPSDTISIEEGDRKRVKVEGDFTATDDTTVTTMDMTDAVKWNIDPASCANIIQENGEHWIRANSHVYNSDGTPKSDDCKNVKLEVNFNYGDSGRDTDRDFEITKRSTITGYRIAPNSTALSLDDSNEPEPFTVYNIYQYSNVSTDTPADGTVEWFVEPLTGATVDGSASKSGSTNATVLVTPISEGEVQLRARVNNEANATADISIYRSFLDSMTIQEVETSDMVGGKLPAGRTMELKVVATFGDGTTADVTRMVTWEYDSSKIEIENGVVTAKNDVPGEMSLDVFATLRNKRSNEKTINLTGAVFDTISFGDNSFTPTVQRGNTLSFDVTLKNSNQTKYHCPEAVQWSAIDPEKLKYKSSAINNACNGSNGDYQCSINTESNDLEVGKYTLAVTCGDNTDPTGTFHYIVTDQVVESIDVISPVNGFSVPIGRNYQLRAQVTYTDGSTADVTSMVDWTSSNEAIASVNELGLFQANSPGDVTVEAALGDVTNDILLEAEIAEFDHIEVRLTSMTTNASAFDIRKLEVWRYDSTGDTTSSELSDFQWSISRGNSEVTDKKGANSWTTPEGLQSAINDQPRGVYALKASAIKAGYDCEFSECSAEDTAYLVVESGSLTGLAITANDTSGDELKIQEGQSFELKARALYSDGSTTDVERIVEWSIDQPANIKDFECAKVVHQENRVALIVTNNQKGKGCKFDLSGIYSSKTSNKIPFEVTPREISGYRIEPAQHVMTLGETQEFKVYRKYQYSDLSADLATKSVSWTIDPVGGGQTDGSDNATTTVTPLVEGTVTLKAIVDGKEATGTITIFDKVINNLEVKLLNENDPVLVDNKLPESRSLRLLAVATFEAGAVDETGDVTDLVEWSSSQPSKLVKIDHGLFQAAGNVVDGESVEVTATLRGKSGSRPVTLTKAVFEEINVVQAVSGVTDTVIKGNPIPISIELKDSNGTQIQCPAPTQELKWKPEVGSFNSASGNCSSYSNGKYTCSIDTNIENLVTGRYQIKTYCEDNPNIAVLADFIVTDKEVSSIKIFNLPARLEVPKGRSWQLRAEATYSDDTSADVTSMVDWESSESDFGTVSIGYFTGKAIADNVTISATLGAGVDPDETKISVIEAEFDHITITSDPLVVYPGTFDQSKLAVYRVDSSDSSSDALVSLFSWSVTDSSGSVISNNVTIGELTTAIKLLPEGIYTLKAKVPADNDEYKCPFSGNKDCKFTDTAALVVKKDLSKLKQTLKICEPGECQNNRIYTVGDPLVLARGETINLKAMYDLEDLGAIDVAEKGKWSVVSTGDTANRLTLSEDGVILAVNESSANDPTHIRVQYNDISADAYIHIDQQQNLRVCIKPDPQDVSGDSAVSADWLVQSGTNQWKSVLFRSWGGNGNGVDGNAADGTNCVYEGGADWYALENSTDWSVVSPVGDVTFNDGILTVTNPNIANDTISVRGTYRNNATTSDYTLKLQKITELDILANSIYLPIDGTFDLSSLTVNKLYNQGIPVLIDHDEISWKVVGNNGNVTLADTLLTGNTVGTVTLTAYLTDNNAIEGTIEVRVVPISATNEKVKSIEIINLPTESKIPKGRSWQLRAEAVYLDNTRADVTSMVTWLSLNTNRGDFSNLGNFTAKLTEIGDVTVRATLGTHQGSETLNVIDADFDHITITSDPLVVYPGTFDESNLTVRKVDSSDNGSDVSADQFSWSVTDSSGDVISTDVTVGELTTAINQLPEGIYTLTAQTPADNNKYKCPFSDNKECKFTDTAALIVKKDLSKLKQTLKICKIEECLNNRIYTAGDPLALARGETINLVAKYDLEDLGAIDVAEKAKWSVVSTGDTANRLTLSEDGVILAVNESSANDPTHIRVQYNDISADAYIHIDQQQNLRVCIKPDPQDVSGDSAASADWLVQSGTNQWKSVLFKSWGGNGNGVDGNAADGTNCVYEGGADWYALENSTDWSVVSPVGDVTFNEGILTVTNPNIANDTISVRGTYRNNATTSDYTLKLQKITELDISANSIYLPIDGTFDLSSLKVNKVYNQGVPVLIDHDEISWKVVGNNGNVTLADTFLTGNAFGTVTLTAYLTDNSAIEGAIEVRVVPVSATNEKVKSIEIINLPTESKIPKGRSWQLRAEAVYLDNTRADVTSMVTWLSLQTNLGDFSNLGNFTAKSTEIGDVTVRATLGTHQGSETLNVIDADFDHITITSDPLVVYPGKFDQSNLTVRKVDSSDNGSDVSADQFSWSVTDSSGDVISTYVTVGELTTAINQLPEGIYTLTAQTPADNDEYKCPFSDNKECKFTDTAALVIKKDLSKLKQTLKICKIEECQNNRIYTAGDPLALARGETINLVAKYDLEDLGAIDVAEKGKWSVVSTGDTANRLTLSEDGVILAVNESSANDPTHIRVQYNDISADAYIHIDQQQNLRVCIKPDPQDVSGDSAASADWLVQSGTNQWNSVLFKAWGGNGNGVDGNAADGTNCVYEGGADWYALENSTDWSVVSPVGDVTFNDGILTVTNPNIANDTISVRGTYRNNATTSDYTLKLQKITELDISANSIYLPIDGTFDLGSLKVNKVYNQGVPALIDHSDINWKVVGNNGNVTLADTLLTGNTIGTVTLTAYLTSNDAIEGNIDVRVVPVIEKLVITDSTNDINDVSDFNIHRGDTKKLYAYAVYSQDQSDDISDSVTWESSLPDDVTADNGVLTAIFKENSNDQSADITVSYLDVAKTVSISVRQPQLQNVCLAPNGLDITSDETGKYYQVYQNGTTNRWDTTSFNVWGSDQSTDCATENYDWLDLNDSHNLNWDVTIDVDPSTDITWDGTLRTMDVTSDNSNITMEYVNMKVRSDSSDDVSSDIRLRFQKITDIAITTPKLNLPVGQEITLAEIGLEKVFNFGENISLSSTEVTWSIEGDNSSDLVMYDGGKVRGKDAGRVTLKATLNNVEQNGEAIEATADLWTNAILQSLRLTESLDRTTDMASEVVMVKGERLQLYPLAIYSTENPYLDERVSAAEVIWSSDNSSDVSADNGVITALQEGSGPVKVTASWQGASKAFNVTVLTVQDSSPDLELRLTRAPSNDSLRIGESINLSARLFNKNSGQEIVPDQANDSISWTVSGVVDLSVDTTTDVWDVMVTGRSEGAYTITVDVTDDSTHFTETWDFTVTKPSIGRLYVTDVNGSEYPTINSSSETVTLKAVVENVDEATILKGTDVGSIQWYVNGAPINDETGDTITITDSHISTAGKMTMVPVYFTISQENFENPNDDVSSDNAYLLKFY